MSAALDRGRNQVRQLLLHGNELAVGLIPLVAISRERVCLVFYQLGNQAAKFFLQRFDSVVHVFSPLSGAPTVAKRVTL